MDEAERDKIIDKTLATGRYNIPFFPKLWHKLNYKANTPNLNSVWHNVRYLNNKPNPTYVNAKDKRIKPLRHLYFDGGFRTRYGDNNDDDSGFYLLQKLNRKHGNEINN